MPRRQTQEQVEVLEHGDIYFFYRPRVREAGRPAPQQKAGFPQQLQERFGNRRFIDLDPPELLDYERVELLFIGASEDISEELGLELDAQRETERTAEIFNDLRLKKSEHRLGPLFAGKWG